MVGHDDIYLNAELPSLFWRTASYQTILATSAVARAFLYGLNKTEVHGLPRFLEILKSRSDYRTRRKGLLTVSNHISVLDDPLIWGVLPLSFAAFHGYMNHRWSFGSHDICFQNGPLSHFFTLGQVLPIHRSAHSPYGGPFQATMTEGVRLFSKISTENLALCPLNNPRFHSSYHSPSWPTDCVDPFSDTLPVPAYPSQPSDVRWYHAPSRYASNAYGWVHIFPEGMIHQAPDQTMRYFKWGVARLILEPLEAPDIVPMFIEGTDKIMHESRTFPRFLPRIGKKVTVTFGKELDVEETFGDLRKRWRELADKDAKERGNPEWDEIMLGIVPEGLTNHPEAIELRKECTKRVRDAVLEVRRSRGLPDEDPKSNSVETWRKEGPKREGKMDDGSWVKDT
ncbi:Lyso-phosphatidylcholine acyltransferase [Exophiala xenobiotica]|nr:Lyso-phosphatidylcholine acyltransferase [Exophiala xenobiotica]